MDSALLSMASEFSGLPIDSLIGGPLNAAAKANAAMALTQTKFMLDTCFKATGTGSANTYEPILIEMTLKRGTDEMTFKLPLLTIIPLNSLAVNNVDITFEMEVKSSYSEDQSETKEKTMKGEASLEAKVGWGPFSCSIKGSASYDQKDSSTHDTHYQKSNSAKYTVHVTAGQLPIPKGVNIIIEAFSKSIEAASSTTPNPPKKPNP